MHVPVLLESTLTILDLRSGLVVVDGTVGAGGHATGIAEAIGPDGHVVGLDRDKEILAVAQEALAKAKGSGAGAGFSLHHSPHANLREVLAGIGQSCCDRVLLDIGVSSLQLDRPERGFSFMADGPLDMRMDATATLTAERWLSLFRCWRSVAPAPGATGADRRRSGGRPSTHGHAPGAVAIPRWGS